MRKLFVWCGALSACILPAVAQAAVNINGLFESPRVFNDFTTSTLNIDTSNFPVSATIDDRNLTDDGIGGNFANRHDLLFSSDGGTSPHQFDIDDGFTVKGIFNLEVGSVAPRKEAGIRINSPITGDVQFIINSDAGEIVSFGGGAQSYSFSGGPQPDYVPGTDILLGLTYSGGTSSPRTVDYFIDRDPSTPGGIEFAIAGPFVWSNLENGPVNFNVGFYGQVSPANANDFMTLTIDNPMFVNVPEPSTLGLLTLAMFGLAACARRRRS